jgi:Ni,Fe-hydrogenase maturation factor
MINAVMRNPIKKRVFCFGNPLVKRDSLPILLLPELRKEFPVIEFIEAESPEDIEEEPEINIIDTVEGIKEAREVDLDEAKLHKCCSLHDFDLAMSLKLLKKMGKLKTLRIIGIPVAYSKKQAMNELKKLIPAIISS